VGYGGFLGADSYCTILTSPDGGVTLTNRTSTSGLELRGIAYGNNQFVAVGGYYTAQPFGFYCGPGAILTSPDGITWTSRTSGTFNELFAITYGNNLFVALGGDGLGFVTILTSPDGITWTPRDPSGATGELVGIAYGMNQFAAVDGCGDLILTSPDGITWTKRTSGGLGGYAGIAYGNNLFVAPKGETVTSADGITWTRHGAEQLSAVCYGNNLFVGVRVDRVILTSPDGITWTSRTSVMLNQLFGITYGNNTFVGVGAAGTIETSPDGITWITRASPTSDWIGNTFFGIAYGSKTFVTVGMTGIILQSGVVVPMQPTLGSVGFVPGGAARVTLTGLPGQTYSIQASTNLQQWLTITNVTLTTPAGQFVDTSATNFPLRFYRAVAQ
jgi:hypothetical protein